MRFAGSQLSNFRDPSNFDGISKASMQGRSTERMYDAHATGLVDKAGIDAEGMIKRAKYGASGIRAEGSAAGNSARMGGISSGIGSLAGGFMNKPSGLGDTGNTVYGLGGGAGQGELLAPLSTGNNATSLLNSFLGR